MPDHPLKKNKILDIFYNGLIDASRDHLDSCAGCIFRERTVEQAKLLLNNILSNDNDWKLPEPTPKNRGILFLSPEDMQEAKKSMKEKGIKAEDVKNLPPIEEIHCLNIPPVEETYNFVQIEEENLPPAWGRFLQLLNAFPDHPLKKNEILDIFYNGLTDACRDYLDSCVGCVFR